MAKKQNRRARRSKAQQHGTARAARRQFLNTPSLIFLGLIVLMVALAATAMLLAGDDVPDCPPGQVWSDEHGHCH